MNHVRQTSNYIKWLLIILNELDFRFFIIIIVMGLVAGIEFDIYLITLIMSKMSKELLDIVYIQITINEGMLKADSIFCE